MFRSIKVKYDEACDEITNLPKIVHFCKNIKYDGPAPSQGAKSLNYVDIQRQSDGAIYDGRYPHDGKPTTASPIHIFHLIFEAFIRRLQRPTQEPTRRYMKLVGEIMDLLTQIRRPEWKRGRDIRKALKEVLGHNPILETNDDDTRTDSNIVIESRRRKGGCDPSTQAALSVRHFWVTQESFSPIRDKTCCPTILLAGGGAWLAVLGVVFTDRSIVQRFTNMLWMGNSTTHREEQLLHLAHMFLALHDSIQNLSEYYMAVATNQKMQAFNRNSNDPHPRFFPYVTSVNCQEMGLIQFKYLRRLEDDAACVTFLAQLLDGSDEIVVKFVTTYNAEVHRMLHEKGYAPALLYHDTIPTADTILDTMPLLSDQGAQFRRLLPLMNMVDMEYIKPGTWPASREDAKRQLKDALNTFMAMDTLATFENPTCCSRKTGDST
ncbi:hypothetical protein AX14_002803 [Amanita brunnescens Koide BX004]|nr:hypothetical protein AX14_002803 [Amanita brunnescens Koide BX004]